MKCPSCEKNHPYKEGMTCKCGYQFAVDPKKDGFADGKILAAVARASEEGARYFTQRQFATAIYRKAPSVFMLVFGALLIGLSVVASLVLETFAVGFVMILIGTILIIMYFTLGTVDVAKALLGLKKYEAAKGSFEFLLRDNHPLREAPPEWDEDDIFDYGVEGILIVDSDVMVDFLVMNQLHSANRVLVVSEKGYPSYIVPHVNQLLDENPELNVYAMHGTEGVGAVNGMVERLQESSVFDFSDIEIVDLGLSQADLDRLPKLRRFEEEGRVPIDYLQFSKLAGGLTQMLGTGLVFKDIIGQSGDSVGGDFG